MKQRLFLAAAAAAACTALTGCGFLSSTADSIGNAWKSAGDAVTKRIPTALKIYRPDVNQGNLITEEMCQHLQVGMSREQVVLLIGNPLLVDPFHKDRWDYTFYVNKLSGETSTRRLTVWFDDAQMVRKIERDAMPTETEADEMALGRRNVTDYKEKSAKPAPAPAK